MNRSAPTTRHRDEGFSLVEIIVVMIILCILGGIGFGTMRSSKTTASKQEAIAAAHSMQKAIENFRLDREGRVPSAPADWAGAAELGPQDTTTARPYMRVQMPTGISFVAQTAVGAGVTPIATPRSVTGATYTVTYTAMGSGAARSTYDIQIMQLGKATPVCELTNGPGGTNAC